MFGLFGGLFDIRGEDYSMKSFHRLWVICFGEGLFGVAMDSLWTYRLVWGEVVCRKIRLFQIVIHECMLCFILVGSLAYECWFIFRVFCCLRGGIGVLWMCGLDASVVVLSYRCGFLFCTIVCRCKRGRLMNMWFEWRVIFYLMYRE